MIKHVTLDLWLTLIKSNHNYKNERATACIRLVKEFYGATVVWKTMKEIIHWVEIWHDNTMMTTGEHKVSIRELWILVLHRMGILEYTPEQISAFVNQSAQLFYDYPPQFIEEDIISTLEEMGKMGISFDIISNTGFIESSVLTSTRSLMPIFEMATNCFFSDYEGLAKPNKDMFLRTIHWSKLQGNKLIPSNVLHVGDNHIADVQGAKAAGFNALLFGSGRELKKLANLPNYIRLINKKAKDEYNKVCTSNSGSSESSLQQRGV